MHQSLTLFQCTNILIYLMFDCMHGNKSKTSDMPMRPLKVATFSMTKQPWLGLSKGTHEVLFKAITDRLGKTFSESTKYCLCLQGCSASGKSTLAHNLAHLLTSAGLKVFVLQIDSFYKPLQDPNIDFDNPASIDWVAVLKVLKALHADEEYVEMCEYSFVTKERRTNPIKNPRPNVIIIEGIYAFNLLGDYVFNTNEMDPTDTHPEIEARFISGDQIYEKINNSKPSETARFGNQNAHFYDKSSEIIEPAVLHRKSPSEVNYTDLNQNTKPTYIKGTSVLGTEKNSIQNNMCCIHTGAKNHFEFSENGKELEEYFNFSESNIPHRYVNEISDMCFKSRDEDDEINFIENNTDCKMDKDNNSSSIKQSLDSRIYSDLSSNNTSGLSITQPDFKASLACKNTDQSNKYGNIIELSAKNHYKLNKHTEVEFSHKNKDYSKTHFVTQNMPFVRSKPETEQYLSDIESKNCISQQSIINIAHQDVIVKLKSQITNTGCINNKNTVNRRLKPEYIPNLCDFKNFKTLNIRLNVCKSRAEAVRIARDVLARAKPKEKSILQFNSQVWPATKRWVHSKMFRTDIALIHGCFNEKQTKILIDNICSYFTGKSIKNFTLEVEGDYKKEAEAECSGECKNVPEGSTVLKDEKN